jgi:hypothetical protein
MPPPPSKLVTDIIDYSEDGGKAEKFLKMAYSSDNPVSV